MNGEIVGSLYGKVWGTTRCLFIKNNTEIHRITINKGGFCSKHKHQSKFNGFFLESGKLKIKVWKNNYDLCDEIIMNPGDFTTVNPMEFHQFEALQDCIAFEVYWSELDPEDIQRDNCGGIK